MIYIICNDLQLCYFEVFATCAVFLKLFAVIEGFESLSDKKLEAMTNQEVVGLEKMFKERLHKLKSSKKYCVSFGNKLIR